MKNLLLTSVVVLLLLPLALLAQTNEWATQYVTFDDAINGTENRTPSVGVVGPNNFVGLVTRGSSAGGDLINYLVGYSGADSANGRLNGPPAGGVGSWEFALDKVDLTDAFQLAGGPDNLVYLANNDVFHNILVFELTSTEVAGSQYRMQTGDADIWAIDVDANGYVFVCTVNGDDTNTEEVKVYPPVTDANAAWATTHDSAPMATIDLPSGEYRGIAASAGGSQVFVSQSSERKMIKFTGSPTGGYSADNSFNLTLDPNDIGTHEEGTFTPTLLGLSYLDNPGIVFAAADTLFFPGESSGGYPYGRVYVIDGATGANVDTIDVAQWNFDHAGDYSSGSNDGLWSGFTSTYDTDVEAFDQAVYSQSHYGWAVDKWRYDGDLSLIVSVEQIAQTIPATFALKQNYPNPFNPSTSIEFDLQNTAHVTLSVYNTLGQKVATLVNERLTPGGYKAVFNATEIPNGIYYYTLETGSFKTTKKMVLIK